MSLSVFNLGQRVVVSFGLHRGKRGVIEGVRTDDSGAAVIDVLLDGEHLATPFRSSVLMREPQQ